LPGRHVFATAIVVMRPETTVFRFGRFVKSNGLSTARVGPRSCQSLVSPSFDVTFGCLPVSLSGRAWKAVRDAWARCAVTRVAGYARRA
jgi:hypothetical protein